MHPTGPYSDDLALAMRIADQVDVLTLANFAGEELTVEIKADESPVTAIDRGAEALIRQLIEEARPADAVLGEEFGAHGGGKREWIIDPIDGTKNYIRDIPVWATLIALLDEGTPVVGVVSAPALGKRWFAARGEGAWMGPTLEDATALRVSERSQVAEATLSYSSLAGWDKRGLFDGFMDVTRAVWRTRAFGDFWSYMMVAEGIVEIAMEPELSLWDVAALVPIVTEAGGHMTSLDGSASVNGSAARFGGDAIATNGLIHQDIVELLKP